MLTETHLQFYALNPISHSPYLRPSKTCRMQLRRSNPNDQPNKNVLKYTHVRLVTTAVCHCMMAHRCRPLIPDLKS